MSSVLIRKIAIYRNEIVEHGIGTFFLAHIQKVLLDPLSYLFYKVLYSFISFSWKDAQLSYLAHWYNFTWESERAIEVPIFSYLVQTQQPKKILEVGNVLSHYQSVHHTIIDKYEIAPMVQNVDVVRYKPNTTFDLIISISTLEHVGLHEPTYTKNKSIHAIAHLQSLLTKKGKLIFSIPLGVNKDLDTAIREKKIPLRQCVFYRRISRVNRWQHVSYDAVKDVLYNSPYPHANAIMIATLTKYD